MKKKKLPLIVDTDPGVDDTLAMRILFGSDKLDIRLVCSVAGNVSIDLTTVNTLYLTRLWGGDIPVARGCVSPLGVDAAYVHGAGGLGGYKLPPQNRLPDQTDAVEATYRVLDEAEEPVTFITFGPMTNIGLLLKKHPGIENKIARIYAMIASKDGTGNITPYAEFNAYCDPPALRAIIDAGIETVFAPMHLGRESKLPMSELLARAEGTDMAAMMKDMFSGYRDSAAGDGYVAMYDANAAEALLRPGLYDFVRCGAAVNVTDKPGQTFLDADPDGKFFRIEIRDKQELADAMYEDLFGKQESKK